MHLFLSFLVLSTQVFFLFSIYPNQAQAMLAGTVTARIGGQSSRDTQSYPINLFSGHTSEVKLKIEGLCADIYSLRVDLHQVSGKLAVPLGNVYEATRPKINLEDEQSLLTIAVPLPQTNRIADFKLVTLVRQGKDTPWVHVDTTAIRAFPTDLFQTVAEYKNFTFVLFDPLGNLQKLFAESAIPFINYNENPDIYLQSDPDKPLIALCHLPDDKNRDFAAESIKDIKEVTEHSIVFKSLEGDLAKLLIRESEIGVEVQAEKDLLDDLTTNPQSRNYIMSLIKLVVEFTLRNEEQ